MLVKHVHTGGNHTPDGYSSSIKYWRDKKGITGSVHCANKSNCRGDGKGVHGGHVKKVNGTDDKWYIVPLCIECNETKELTFEVDADQMVPVNQ